MEEVLLLEEKIVPRYLLRKEDDRALVLSWLWERYTRRKKTPQGEGEKRTQQRSRPDSHPREDEAKSNALKKS